MMEWNVKKQIVSIRVASHGHVKFTFKVTEAKFSVKKEKKERKEKKKSVSLTFLTWKNPKTKSRI